MTDRVDIDTVVDLCLDLGVIPYEEDRDKAYDSLLSALDQEGEDFLPRYTEALLKGIQVGSSYLLGEEERYKGFGVVDGEVVTMTVKTRC